MCRSINRSLARRALDLRDDLLAEHLATLRRVRRLVLDGSLVRTEVGYLLSRYIADHVERARRQGKESQKVLD